jgi:3-hydroxy-9,10-secoandrosta-1,3,5(10)-triene-9,17-dione monooxygenase reductase component
MYRSDFPAAGCVEDGTLNPSTFRTVMSQWVTGVAIVTASDGDMPIGIVCNSLTSVSLDPLLLLWTVDRSSSSFDYWLKAEHWALHLLADDQSQLVKQFAQKGGDKFEGVTYQQSEFGVPLLPNSLVRLGCKTWERIDAGDHVIMIGEVHDFEQRETTPLTFIRGSLVPARLPDQQSN